MEPTPAGIVGLGLVGSAIAHRLRQAGLPTLGFDSSGAACEAFAARGGRLARSLADLGARAGTVVLAVYETRDVLSVLEGPHGLLEAGEVRTVIDCSTGSPAELEALAQRLGARAIDFLEAPLSGSSQQIESGDATLLLGGTAEAIARCGPLLDALAPRRIHVGPAGFGARAKLATNLVLGLNRAALAEGIVFAENLGIDAETFLALVLATPAQSAAAQVKGPLMVHGDFEPRSRIRQHLKDVELMLGFAREQGLRLPLSAAHGALLRAAVANGDGDLDNAAIVRELRRGAPSSGKKD